MAALDPLECVSLASAGALAVFAADETTEDVSRCVASMSISSRQPGKNASASLCPGVTVTARLELRPVAVVVEEVAAVAAATKVSAASEGSASVVVVKAAAAAAAVRPVYAATTSAAEGTAVAAVTAAHMMPHGEEDRLPADETRAVSSNVAEAAQILGEAWSVTSHHLP